MQEPFGYPPLTGKWRIIAIIATILVISVVLCLVAGRTLQYLPI